MYGMYGFFYAFLPQSNLYLASETSTPTSYI